MRLEKIKNVKPYHGIIIFIISVALLILVAPFQRMWGMYGLAVTELVLLGLGLFAAFLFRDNFKEIFPIYRPRLSQVLGVIILWIASFILNLLIIQMTLLFFPEMMTVSSGLESFFGSVPLVLALIIGAVMPAICEEVVHRGVILHTFKSINNKWIVILSMGLIFGLFHLDPYRFLPTALLGAVLSYIMITTKNFLLPVLLHFINNGISISLDSLNSTTSPAPSLDIHNQYLIVGALFIISSIVPILYLLGSKLIKKNVVSEDGIERSYPNNKKTRKIQWIFSIFFTVFMVIGGGALIASNIQVSNPYFSIEENMDIKIDSENLEYPMTINEAGKYELNLSMSNERGISNLRILNSDGEEVYQLSAQTLTLQSYPEFEKGSYTVIIEFYMSDNADDYIKLNYNYTDEFKENLNITNDINDVSKFEFKLDVKKLG